VDDLLEVSAAETERLSLTLEPVDVLALANESIRANTSRARAKGVHLHLACDHPTVVQLDRQKIQRVFNELLTNAIASSRPGQNVEFRLSGRKKHVDISVHDEGPAIPPGALRKLFTPFSGEARLRASIGLALAARIVDAHKGRIHASSRTGAGSTFVVSLPVARKGES
jgi:signal transduction histidine kinase